MTKLQKIKTRAKYWIKVLKLQQSIIIKTADKQEKKEGKFSGYTERKNNKIIIGLNPNIITLRNIGNHIDRVVLHELGHILTHQTYIGKISIRNEYLAEKFMLNTLYKYNIRLYKKLITFMETFLLDECNSWIYAAQYPEHYHAFCKVYNIKKGII